MRMEVFARVGVHLPLQQSLGRERTVVGVWAVKDQDERCSGGWMGPWLPTSTGAVSSRLCAEPKLRAVPGADL